MHYDFLQRCKTDEVTARLRASTLRIVPIDVNVGWVHIEDDTPREPRDCSSCFVPGQVHTVICGDLAYAGLVFPYSAAVVEPASTMTATGTTSDADCLRIVRRYLEEAGVFLSTESVMSIAEKRRKVCGRCSR